MAGGFATRFAIEGCWFYDNEVVGLAVAGGSASVSHSTFSHNPVALHAQCGDFLTESSSAGAVAQGELRISPDTKFIGNVSKVGNGEIPLPPDPLK